MLYLIDNQIVISIIINIHYPELRLKGEIKKQVNKPMALIKRDLNFLFTQLLF